MSIFKYLTLSHLQKVLAALEVRFTGVENEIEEINEININTSSRLNDIENNIPLPYDDLPNADFNNGIIGTSDLYARGDHRHPSDPSKANVSDVLIKTNTIQYLPTNDYNPATKLYVDTKCNEPVVGTGTITISGITASFTSLTPSQVTVYWSRKNPVYYYESLGQGTYNKRRYELISVVNDGSFYDFVFYGTDGSSDIYITTHIYSSNSDATSFNGTVHSYPAGVVQSDWNENDTTDNDYILNKPAIKAGEGENSIIEGNMSQGNNAAIYTIYITGEASATTFTYTTNDSLPSSLTGKMYTYVATINTGTNIINKLIKSIDAINNTISFNSYVTTTSALTNAEVKIFYRYTLAKGDYSHIEGSGNTALGKYSHAEGYITKAVGVYSHAEGSVSVAGGNYSHAEGSEGVAQGLCSHAEGDCSWAIGYCSHAEGQHTIASGSSQHVQGKYNIEDTNSTYADIVGNGGADNTRSNAYTLDWNGNGWYAGKLTVSVGPTNNMDVATKYYVDTTKVSFNDVLTKTNITTYTPTANYHPATKKYVDDATAGITTNLSGLTDTIITSPSDGQILQYNLTTLKWENTSLPVYGGEVTEIWNGGNY